MSTGRFRREFKIVAVAHVAVVAVLFVASGWQRLRKPRPTVEIPVELTLQAAPADPAPAVVPLPDAPPEPPPPKPAPSPPDPPPPPRRKPVVPSRRLVTRPVEQPAPRTPTAEELRNLLAEELAPRHDTALPNEDAVCFEKVRQALHGAWAQPSREEAGGDVVRASIGFDAGGRITSRRLSAPSGNAVLDRSVREALDAVDRVPGLTAGFLERHPTVTIAFNVE